MAALTNVEVVIGGKVYTLSGYEGQDYLQKVATYINEKINEFDAMGATRHLPNDMRGTFIQLNIADDYFKAKNQAEKLEQDLRMKDRELYDLKHELISAQMTYDGTGEHIRELETENRELLMNQTRLEAENRELLTEQTRLEMENKELLTEQTRLETENKELLTEQTRLETENKELLMNQTRLEAENKELLIEQARLKKDLEKALLENMNVKKETGYSPKKKKNRSRRS